MGKKTLLLGAGFSYELGLPLSMCLTKDFYSYLNPKKITSLIDQLKMNQPYGDNRPIDKEAFKTILEIFTAKAKKKLGYEALISVFENELSTPITTQPTKDTYHYFAFVLKDIASQILWRHQERRYEHFLKNEKYYKLIDKYLEEEEVFVFTLNHDICFEMLCIDYSIPFSFGTDEEVVFSKSNLRPHDTIKFVTQKRDDVSSGKNYILKKPIFNIIKLHGAFNEYGFNDDSNILTIDTKECNSSNEYLKKVASAWNETEYIINGHNVRMGEFISVTDLMGEFQILSKSLLIGGKKYSITINQKPGEEKLQLFEKILRETDELTILGYGFGDLHINTRIYNAMILNENLKIKRIEPKTNIYPELFNPVNYAMRLSGGMCTSTQWLYYRIFEKWESDKDGEMKVFLNHREKIDTDFRSKYFGRYMW